MILILFVCNYIVKLKLKICKALVFFQSCVSMDCCKLHRIEYRLAYGSSSDLVEEGFVINDLVKKLTRI